MSIRKDVTDVCAYFFEVLVKQFLELEKAIHKQSGLFSLFKKIDYMDRANAFNGLMDRAIEARESLPLSDEAKGDYEIYSLAAKLTECLAIYINMVETQININHNLNHKVNGEKYNWNEYTTCLQHFGMLRGGLEAELSKLQSLYAAVLKTQEDTETISGKEAIKENQLVEIVILEYLTDLESDFDNILSSLRNLGFDLDDFEDESWMKYDIFLCGLTLDAMALFNLLDNSQANRIFRYISVEKFTGLDNNKEQIDYSISEVAEYKNIWDKSIEKSEPPFDFVFSKLYDNLLGENIQKYNIGPLHMIQIISLVMPIFAGKWKNALEKYNPTQ